MDNYLTQIMDYLKTQSWQIAVLVVVVAGVALLLRNRSAHVRYLLWLIVLAKCLVPPLLTVPLAVLPVQRAVITFAPTEPIAVEPARTSAAVAPTQPVPVIVKHTPTFTLRQWLAIGWIVGVAMFILMAMAKALRTELWLRRERKPLPTGLQSEIKDLFANLGVRISPKVWLVEGIGQPFVWGLLRGSIYLPGNFVKANNAGHRRGILGHELSHILRFDATVNLLQVMAQALFWFHPLVWWANKRIRAEREKCCDEMAIAHLGTQARDYSDAIVNILISESESTRPVPSLAVAGPVKNIEERIKTMLKPGKKFYKRPSLPVAAVVILTALLSAPTTVVLTVRAEDHPTTESAEAGQIFFGDPTNIGPIINSSSPEWDPHISTDGLSLYFLSRRPGGLGSADIWVTTRKTKDDPWGTPVNLGSPINSPAFEGAPCTSADGLELYFVSDRPAHTWGLDIWVAARKSKDEPWGVPVNLGPTVNSPAAENGPSISADSLSLYFSTHIWGPYRSGGMGEADIWVTTRKSKDEPWGAPVNLGPTVNSTVSDVSPCISADALSLYFCSSRSPGFGEADIWVTTRKTKDGPWGTPLNLGSKVNSPDPDLNVEISSDGSTLYFVSKRPGNVGGPDDPDIWQVSLNLPGEKE